MTNTIPAVQAVFENKVVPSPFVEKRAWILRGPAATGNTDLAEALYAHRRVVVEHARKNAVFISAGKQGPAIAAQAYALALANGYSMFLDVPADAATVRELKENGYHTRLIGVYARAGQPSADGLNKMNDMIAAAHTFSLRYAPVPGAPYTEILYLGSTRSAPYGTPRKVVIGDRAALARLLRDLRAEGGHALAQTIQQWAGPGRPFVVSANHA